LGCTNATGWNESGWEGAVPQEDPKVRRPAWKKGWTPFMGDQPALNRKMNMVSGLSAGKSPWTREFLNLWINQGIPGSW
jgi:hypothetical protein